MTTADAMFFCLPHERLECGANTCTLYQPDKKLCVNLPSTIGRLLARCDRLVPLREHVRAMLGPAELEGGNAWRAAQQVVARLVKAGLFVSKDELVQELTANARRSTRSPPIQSLALITRNRPALAIRCLRSFVANHERHGRSIDYIILDDSPDADTRLELRRGVARFSRQCEARIFYAGPTEKRAYARALVEQTGLPRQLIDFALFGVGGHGFAAGANRNAALLNATGALFAVTDDDIVCRLVASPARETGIHFDTRGYRVTTSFFASRADFFGELGFEDVDGLKIHEAFLGSPVGSCIRKLRAQEVHIESLSPHQLLTLLRGTPRVIATGTGVAGDPGIRPFTFYLQQSGSARAQLVQSKRFYLAAVRNRRVRFAPTMPSFLRSGWMAGFSAYDHRRLLPPFMPMGYDEDGVFSRTVATCFRDAWFCKLPWAVVHDRSDVGGFNRDSIRASFRNVQSHLVHSAIAAYEGGCNRLESMDDEQRLRGLGRYLIDLGSLSQPAFEQQVRVTLWKQNSERATILRNMLQRYDEQPAYWASDVRFAIKCLESSICDPNVIPPADLRESRTRAQARKLSQEFMRRLGELFLAWPEMVTGAAVLKRAQTQIAKPLKL